MVNVSVQIKNEGLVNQQMKKGEKELKQSSENLSRDLAVEVRNRARQIVENEAFNQGGHWHRQGAGSLWSSIRVYKESENVNRVSTSAPHAWAWERGISMAGVKVRGTGRSIEQWAIDKKLTDKRGRPPGYLDINIPSIRFMERASDEIRNSADDFAKKAIGTVAGKI